SFEVTLFARFGRPDKRRLSAGDDNISAVRAEVHAPSVSFHLADHLTRCRIMESSRDSVLKGEHAAHVPAYAGGQYAPAIRAESGAIDDGSPFEHDLLGAGGRAPDPATPVLRRGQY